MLCTSMPWSTWKRPVQKEKKNFKRKRLANIDLFEDCDWAGHIFGASASPRSITKSWLSSSSTVHGGQHDTKYVISELLLHATFVADGIWGDMLEPARR